MTYPKINFSKFEPYPELVYDTLLAADVAKVDELARLVVTHYKTHVDNDAIMDGYEKYQNLINVAIKSDNLKGLETLWKGIYYHDRDNPDFLLDLYTALEYANLETVKHVHYAYQNYNTLNMNAPIDLDKAKEIAGKNPNSHVLEYAHIITNSLHDSDDQE
jgi:hypothetical protein